MWSPPKLVGLNVDALAAVFRRLLLEQRFSEPEELPLPVVTVAEKIAEVLALLAERDRIPVEDALLTATSRFAVVVTFLAVLELWHRRRIIVVQEQLFGPIEITLAPSQPNDREQLRPQSSPNSIRRRSLLDT